MCCAAAEPAPLCSVIVNLLQIESIIVADPSASPAVMHPVAAGGGRGTSLSGDD